MESSQLFGGTDGIISILTIENLQIRKRCQFLKVQRIPDWNADLCVPIASFSTALGASTSITTTYLKGTKQPNIILL